MTPLMWSSLTPQKSKTSLFIALLALIVCICFTSSVYSSYVPELEAYILPSSSINNFFTAAGFTGGDYDAKFMFEVQSGLSTDDYGNIRITLPQYIVNPNSTLTGLLSGSGITSPLSLTTSVSETSINAVLTIRCEIPAQTEFITNGVYTLDITGIMYDASVAQLSLACNSSFVTFANAASTIVQLIDNDQENAVGDANLCCYDNGIYYYGQNNSMSANVDVSQCSLPVAYGLGLANSTNQNRLKFYSYQIGAENNNIAGGKTTLDAVVHTAVQLPAYNRTSGGAVNEVVPSYLWYYLPQYRASPDVLTGDAWNATALGVSCQLSVNGIVVTAPETVLSPATLVRPINDADQSQGIIVQCALGSDIAANSDIKSVITGVYAPTTAPAAGDICTLYGLTSSISSCCNGLLIQFRYGNAVGDDVLYISTDASICPMYAETQSDADNIANSVLVSDVDFVPTQVTVGTTVSNAQYSFVPTVGIAANTRYIVHLPGFNLTADDQNTLLTQGQVNTTINVVIDGDSSNVVTIDNCIATLKGYDLMIDFLIPQALSANSDVVLFLPKIIPTATLPAYSECATSAIGGTATTDGLCCQEFKIEYVISGVKFTSYATSCAALTGVTVINCENDWGYTKCCAINAIRVQLSDSALDKCYAYECTGDDFDVATCCNIDEYRTNTRCCSNAYFCPNQCCGAIAPISGFVEYFNDERCCEPAISEALNLEAVCHCYDYANSNSWDELYNNNCCNVELNNATEIINGTAGGTTLTPFCRCETLFDELHPKNGNNTIDLTVQSRISIISNFTASYPHFDIGYCCSDTFSSIPNWWNDDAYCNCLNNYGTNTMQLACCSYPVFASATQCQPEIANSTVCPEVEVVQPDCGCQCGGSSNNSSVSCCKFSETTINITNIVSQQDTILELTDVKTDDDDNGSSNTTACGCAGCVSAKQSINIVGADNLVITNETEVEASSS